MIECDVTREATSDILTCLKHEGLYDDGAVAVSAVDAAPSRNARATEKAAPARPTTPVIWDARRRPGLQRGRRFVGRTTRSSRWPR